MLPEKKRRELNIGKNKYYWKIRNLVNMTDESKLKFEEARQNVIKKNPALKNKRFGIALDDIQVYSISELYIETAAKPHKTIKARFNNTIIYEPENKVKWLNWLAITPQIVRGVIEFKEKFYKEEKHIVLDNAAELFKSEIIDSLKKLKIWIPDFFE